MVVLYLQWDSGAYPPIIFLKGAIYNVFDTINNTMQIMIY